MNEGNRQPIGNSWRVGAIVVGAVSLVTLGIVADPGRSAGAVQRIFTWTFLAFVVGLVELFLLFVAMTILGYIDLPRVFQDKERGDSKRESVSLSRLQAFLWTLLVMTVFFHSAIVQGDGAIPTLPPEVLLLMGISGAVYLAGKEVSARQAVDEKQASPTPEGGDK